MNYPLLELRQQAGDKYEDFLDGLLTPEEQAAFQDKEAKIMRRGSLIIDDAPLSDDGSQSDDEPACRPATIKWGVPDGFAVAKAPAKIDGSCVGRFIFLNWKDYGWSLGMVKDLITAATPRLYKQYNVRVIWAVEGKLNRSSHGPCKLDLKAYASGPEAPLDSWVFLDKMEAQHKSTRF